MTNKNLVLGKVYTYKELCNAMGEEVAGKGNSRKSQIDRIKQLCDFEKPSGQKYQVTKIYDDDTTAYLQNKNDCSKYLACLILNYLMALDMAGQQDPTLTRNELYKTFWFCNDDYFALLEARRNKEEYYASDCYLPKTNYPLKQQTKDISRWLTVSDMIFRQVLDRAFKELTNKKLCEVHPTYRFYTWVTYGKKKYLKQHDATEEELKQFLGIQNRTLKKYGCNDIRQVYANEDIKYLYFEDVKRTLKEEMGYDNYTRSYKFITMQNIAQSGLYCRPQYNTMIIEKLKESKQTKLIPERLNELMIDKTIKH